MNARKADSAQNISPAALRAGAIDAVMLRTAAQQMRAIALAQIRAAEAQQSAAREQLAKAEALERFLDGRPAEETCEKRDDNTFWITTREAVDLIPHVSSTDAVLVWCKEGLVRSKRSGNRVLVDRDSLLAFRKSRG